MCQTELFIGATYRGLIGEIYDIRSDVEHLHEDRHLETFDRTQRLKIAKLEAVIEWIARSCLRRIVLDPKITPHFANKQSLEPFWSLDQRERKEIWGEPINPWAATKGLNVNHVTDEDLGGP
jgi:hypothetical protein